jgi:alkyl sulfatase BDS1-like metallo-beta-lactamase superfamily hydrolase
MTPAMLFEYLGIALDSNAAESFNLKINVDFIDDEPYLVTIRSGVLLYQKGTRLDTADVSISLSKQQLAPLFLAGNSGGQLPEGVRITGNAGVLLDLTRRVVRFEPFFNTVEP